MNSFYKLSLINLFILGLIVVGYFYGYISPIYNNDISRITYVLSFIIGVNILLEFWTEYLHNFKNTVSEGAESWLDFINDKFLYLGVAGTLIGFSHMMGGISSSATIQDSIESVKIGCLTLGNTTLVGIIGYLWINFNFWLTRKTGVTYEILQ